jgi:hypothetical protein
MNLFRLEEHVVTWSLLAEGGKAGIADPRRLLAEVFGLPRYTRRLDDDYLDRVGEHSAGLPDALKRISSDPWWSPA